MQSRSWLVVIFLLCGTTSLFSQIGGLSASKLATLTTSTVPASNIEFEPSFGFGFSSSNWDNNGKLIPISAEEDSITIGSNFFFRFSYGLAKNWELGVTVPSDVGFISVASKYCFEITPDLSFAAALGVNAPIGNGGYRVFNKTTNHLEYDPAVVVGFIASYSFTNNFSVDFDTQFQNHFGKTVDENSNEQDLFINADFGYYFVGGIQGTIGLNYGRFYYGKENPGAYKLTLSAGATIEKAKNFILVAYFPFDILGKNTSRIFGFGMALTIMID